MEIRPAASGDLPEILAIYQSARAFMRETGNPDQWAGGYPPAALVEMDIRNGNCFVCTESEQLLGVFSYFTEPDPTYARIYEGAWLTEAPYGTIHRVAVKAHGRGVAGFCFRWCFAKCHHLRIDTHRDNLPMQKALGKNGFQKCGIIYLADGQPRIAFEKTE